MEASQHASTCPRVLIVDLSKGYGGSTSRVLALLERAEPGMLGLACLEGGALTEHARRMGLTVHVVGRKKTDPRILFNLVRLIHHEHYQVLDSQNIQSKWWANLATMLTGTALVSTMHSWYGDEHAANSWRGILYAALEVHTNHALALYIAVSRQGVKRLLEQSVPEHKIELIYNAVDLDDVDLPADPAWLRKRFGLPQDSIVCTAVGRLVWAKNYGTLVSATKAARGDVPQLVTVIVGSGDLKGELEAQIRALGLQNHVVLAGYLDRNEVLKVIRSSDIYAMPSRSEGTPIALLEAAALGRPILASSVGGIPELVQDEEHALLCQPDDVQGFAGGLVRLARDRDYAKALGRRGQEHIREAFSLENQVRETWQAYEKAWTGHPRRG